MNNSLAAGMIVFVMVLGLGSGYLGGTFNTVTSTLTYVTTQTQPVPTTTTLTKSLTTTRSGGSDVVSLVVIPDFGGSTYDAFVRVTNINATGPKFATNTTLPGRNNLNVTVQAGVPVKFTVVNLDTAVLENLTGSATTPFTIYTSTDQGEVAQPFVTGQLIKNLPIGHTFTITELNMRVPIPPDTVVTFTHTFDKPGAYLFYCETPCGPGMTTPGYMSGYIIVA